MSKKLVFIIVILVVTALLSGCAGGPVSGATWPGLAADNTTAFLTDGTFIYAINLADGRELWRYPGSRDAKSVFYSTPVFTPDGLVIIGSSGSNYKLVALNPRDLNSETNSPAEAWTFNGAEDHWVAAPLVVDNYLFAPNADGNLYVLDLNDGQSTKRAFKTIPLQGRLWAQPVTDGERIFVSSLDHSLFAIDKDTYEVVWHENVAGAIPGAPVLGTDGYLYVGSFASQLERFDPATGTHTSVQKTDGWVWGTPSSVEDNLYFADLDGRLYSYNVTEARYNWTPVQPDGPITASPLVLGDRILAATESGVVYELNMNGNSKLWSQPGGKIYTTPVMAGDLILIAPLRADASLYAYDQSGHQAWAFTPAK
jgi:outer membrane protein assembly factor BamB